MSLARKDTRSQEDDMLRLFSVIFVIVVLSACGDKGLTPGEGYVDVEGGCVWYRVVGSGSEIPLLLLHGGPGVPSYYLNPLEQVSVVRQ